MIEQQGPRKHLSTLKDRYRCQQNFKYFVCITEGTPRNQNEQFFRNISRSFRLYITRSGHVLRENDQN